MARFNLGMLLIILGGVYLQGDYAQEILLPLPDSILDIEWSPHGRLLAQVLANGQVQVLDTNSHKIISEYLPLDGVELYEAQIDWSTSGDLLAAGIGQSIYIWNIQNSQLVSNLSAGGGETLVEFEAGYSLPEGFVSLDWNFDDSLIMAQSLSSRLTVWTYPSENLMVDKITGNNPIPGVWLPDESGVTTGDRVFDLQTQEFWLLDRMITPEAYNIGAVTVVVSNDDRSKIARGTHRGYIEIVDSITGNTISVHLVKESSIAALSWSPDGTQILSAHQDGTVQITEIAETQVSQVLQSDLPILAVDWSPDGRQIAVGTLLDAAISLSNNILLHFAYSDTGLQIISLPSN